MSEQTGASAPSERMAQAFKNLTVAAKNVNTASGDLAKQIAALEKALKGLNVGVACWTSISSFENDVRFSVKELGHARVNRKWCLAIRTSEGLHNDDPEMIDGELWPFNEAPRYLRVKAVDKIPALIEQLVEATNALTDRLNKKVEPAQEYVAAVTALSNSKK